MAKDSPSIDDDATPPAKGWLRSPFVLGMGLLLVGGAITGTVLLRRGGEKAADPALRQARMLALLDARGGAGARRSAEKIARELRAADYTDPTFGGAIEYALGIIAFEKAEEAVEYGDKSGYVDAIRLLREAEKRALVAERRGDWSYALGISLARIGSATEAEPHLAEAFDLLPHDDRARIRNLLEAAVTTRSEPLLERTVEVGQAVLETAPPEEREPFVLVTSKSLVLLGRVEDANSLLATAPESVRESDAALVFRAQGLVAEGDNAGAIALLQRVIDGGEGRASREALLLAGRAAEAIDDLDNATLHYQRVASRYPNSHEAVAAAIRAAEILRRTGRREESLDAYRRVLESITDPAEFHNRWLGLEELRETVLSAWAELVDGGDYADAIELASISGTLYPAGGAVELEARATKRWAESIQQQFDDGTYTRRQSLREQLFRHWRDAGEVYARLAEELRSSTEYGPTLFEAARHFVQGRAFDRALVLLDEFIATKPKALLPEALLERGRVLFELQRLEDAEAQFAEVASRFPTSPSSYEATLELGRCQHAEGRTAEADATWNAILADDELGPEAAVWRAALLELAQLDLQQAESQLFDARDPRSDAESRRTARVQVAELLDRTVARFGEYLERYDGDTDAESVRFRFARTLQYRAENLRASVEDAETANVRSQLHRRAKEDLARSIRVYRELQEALLPTEAADRLNVLEREFLDRSYLEVARVLYDLGRFEESVVAYSAAANRYPDDARVLVCYVQMANAYQRLGKEIEARSMLQQARLILERLPDDVFRASSTTMSRADWQKWIEWAQQRALPAEETTTRIEPTAPGTNSQGVAA